MYKLITSARDTDDLPFGFDRDRGRRQQEVTNNKNQKGKIHLIVKPKDIFGFAEHQEKATFTLRYILTLTGNRDNSVLNKGIEINIGKSKNVGIEWYVPFSTQLIPQQAFLSKQILSKTPTELQYVEKSVFMKEVKTQNICLLSWALRKA